MARLHSIHIFTDLSVKKRIYSTKLFFANTIPNNLHLQQFVHGRQIDCVNFTAQNVCPIEVVISNVRNNPAQPDTQRADQVSFNLWLRFVFIGLDSFIIGAQIDAFANRNLRNFRLIRLLGRWTIYGIRGAAFVG